MPAVAEMRYLDKVKWLDLYGVDLHPVLVSEKSRYLNRRNKGQRNTQVVTGDKSPEKRQACYFQPEHPSPGAR